MAVRGWGALARGAALAIVAILAAAAVIGGRALLPGQASASPSASADASASPPAPTTSESVPTASPAVPSDIPAELLDKAWLAHDGTSWQVGTLGAGPTSTLPAGEYGLGVNAGLVLSIDRESSSTIFVREIGTGKVVHQMETELLIDDGVIRGDRFYLTGVIKDGDAGVWLGRVGEVGLTQLIPGSEGPNIGEGGTFRTGMKLSPSGKTLASTVCVAPACVTQVVSADGGPALTIADSWTRWVSEDYVVITDRQHIRGYGLDDGTLRWQLDGLDSWDGYFTADGRTFIAQALTESENATKEIWRVDAETGAHEVIATLAADQYLISTLSSNRYAVVLTSPSTGDALASGGASFEVLDLTTGQLVASQPFPRSQR